MTTDIKNQICKEIEEKEGTLIQIKIPSTIDALLLKRKNLEQTLTGKSISKSSIIQSMLIDATDALEKEIDKMRQQVLESI